jgi:broad specificity phosphatase PhoE
MDEVVLARHGESATSARGGGGGDEPLTDRGRAQARALAAALASVPLDVCLTSATMRARETAELALAGRDVPVEVVPELGDVRFGSFERRPLAEYRDWVAAHPPTEAPPGGESRVETLRRFAAAFRSILARPERVVLVVAHGLTIRAVLDVRPQPVVAGAPYGHAERLTRVRLEQAVRRLERWCESPAW